MGPIDHDYVSSAQKRQLAELAPLPDIDMNPETVGAFERFHARIAKFRSLGKSVWVHAFWWGVHNCVAHPLIGILPWFKWTFTFHDWTSLKINASE